VLLVYPTHATENGVLTKVLRGVGDELLGRIARFPDGATHFAAGKPDPTTDPEITKLVTDEMIQEAGVKMLFHCWVADALMDYSAPNRRAHHPPRGRHAQDDRHGGAVGEQVS
jgi:hypothetical protein